MSDVEIKGMLVPTWNIKHHGIALYAAYYRENIKAFNHVQMCTKFMRNFGVEMEVKKLVGVYPVKMPSSLIDSFPGQKVLNSVEPVGVKKSLHDTLMREMRNTRVFYNPRAYLNAEDGAWYFDVVDVDSAHKRNTDYLRSYMFEYEFDERGAPCAIKRKEGGRPIRPFKTPRR